jgi:hypothetical protein
VKRERGLVEGELEKVKRSVLNSSKQQKYLAEPLLMLQRA